MNTQIHIVCIQISCIKNLINTTSLIPVYHFSRTAYTKTQSENFKTVTMLLQPDTTKKRNL